MKEIKRTELIHMGESLGFYDPNDYISQVMRSYPDLKIINDIKRQKSE